MIMTTEGRIWNTIDDFNDAVLTRSGTVATGDVMTRHRTSIIAVAVGSCRVTTTTTTAVSQDGTITAGAP